MNAHSHIPDTVSASLEARLAPFGGVGRAGPHEDLQTQTVAPQAEKRLGLGASLKLLFAALSAGGSVVPLGDNGRTTRLLSEYAASLRDH
jgi:hypothetical protein